MKTVALILYIAAFVADLAGILLVVVDVVKDVSEMRQFVGRPKPVVDRFKRIMVGGRLTQGPEVAYAAAVDANNQSIEAYVTARLADGRLKRWGGVALIVVGSLAGFAGNLASLAS